MGDLAGGKFADGKRASGAQVTRKYPNPGRSEVLKETDALGSVD